MRPLKISFSSAIICMVLSVIACGGGGSSNNSGNNPVGIDLSFTDNGNGTITDNNTLLMWQKEDDDAIYNWYEATGITNATYNPNGTTNVCGNLTLAGYSDWRLPSTLELMSIVAYERMNPAIDSAYFPKTKLSAYWTSPALTVEFTYGMSHTADQSWPYYVRCVRGIPLFYGVFIDLGDGTIGDLSTGLMWQQETGPMLGHNDAANYCNSLSLGQRNDWRLPTIRELQTLLDYGKGPPLIDTKYFPNTYSGYYPPYYQTSTFTPDGNIWSVNFFFGSTHTGNGSLDWERCVRP